MYEQIGGIYYLFPSYENSGTNNYHMLLLDWLALPTTEVIYFYLFLFGVQYFTGKMNVFDGQVNYLECSADMD